MKQVLALAILAASVCAHAQVFYDNGGPNQSTGDEMTLWMSTEDFMLTRDTVWHGLHFWTLENPGAPNDGQLYIGLFDDIAGYPGEILADRTVSEGVDYTRTFIQSGLDGNRDEYRYDVTIADVLLSGNVRYHLGLHLNPTNNYGSMDHRDWETTDANGSHTGYDSLYGRQQWLDNDREHAFNLSSEAVPEPASMTVLALGALALIRRRKN